jgi:hypothetical protein
MNELSEVQKAYLAGLFDGEGCITILKTSPKRRAISCSYRVTLEMNMTDGDQMNYLQKITGIGYVTRHKVYSRPDCRDRWQWTINKDESVELLYQIYPYLVLKKPQAALLIEFVENFVKIKRVANRIDPLLQAKKEEYYLMIKQLKYLTGDTILWPENITLDVVKEILKDRSLLHRCFIDLENENVN